MDTERRDENAAGPSSSSSPRSISSLFPTSCNSPLRPLETEQHYIIIITPPNCPSVCSGEPGEIAFPPPNTHNVIRRTIIGQPRCCFLRRRGGCVQRQLLLYRSFHTRRPCDRSGELSNPTCVLSTTAPTIKRGTVWLSESFEFDRSQEQQQQKQQQLSRKQISENEGVHRIKCYPRRRFRPRGRPALRHRCVLRAGLHHVCPEHGTNRITVHLLHNQCSDLIRTNREVERPRTVPIEDYKTELVISASSLDCAIYCGLTKSSLDLP